MTKKAAPAKTVRKTTTKKASPAKPAARAVRAKVTTAKTAKTTRSRATAKAPAKAKKTVQKKGVLHHVKRIHRMTPKFVHGALVGAFFGMLLLTWVGSTDHAAANPAAAACIKTNGIKVNDVNANTDIKLDKKCGNRKFVMKAWYADSSSGEPHDTQRLFAQSGVVRVQDTDNNATHINVKMPAVGCYYQVDLVDVTNAAQEGNYPIADHKTGGNRNCNPTPSYACSALHASPGANRQVTIDQFNVAVRYATFTRATIDWGDASNPLTTANVTGSQHTYPQDGTYTLNVTAYFNITAQNGETKEKAAPACSYSIPITTTPPTTQQVCELRTGKIVTVPGGSYDTAVYGPANSKECAATTTTQDVCELKTGKVVTVPSGAYDTAVYGPTDAKECGTAPTTPTEPTTPASTLTTTGPGALLVIFVMAAIGGYVFHHGHHHLKKRQQHKKAH